MKNKNILLTTLISASVFIFSSCENEIPGGISYEAYTFSSISEDGGNWKPILLTSGADVAIPAPSDVTSPEYLAELAEVKSAILTDDKAEIEMELGDLFFALINYARFLNIDPESALEKVNQKFIYRFQFIEQNAQKPLVEMTLTEMEALWQAAKM